MRKRERGWGAPFVVTAAPLILGGAVGLVVASAPYEAVRAQPGPEANGLRPLQAGDVVQRDGAGRCFRTPGPCAGDAPCGPAVAVPCPLRGAPARSRLVVEGPGTCMAEFEVNCPPEVPCNPPSPVPVACPGEVTAEQVTFEAVPTVPIIGPGNPPGPTPVTPTSVPASAEAKPLPKPAVIHRNPPRSRPGDLGTGPQRAGGTGPSKPEPSPGTRPPIHRNPPPQRPPQTPVTEAEALPAAPPGAQIIQTPEGCLAMLPQPPCPPDAMCNPPPPMRVKCP